ncbi:MAG: hypothetical protein QNJ41_13485 [Xenococcaceae cyanobacterium MO_188.B32]|nr:hypothetical protein [Xenococcaceae cyanobacterium MO_188.B32]
MSANINSDTNKLGIFSLATLLVSAHYGLGFLLGTAEQARHQGIQGSLYAISIGLGFLALLILAKFYWQQVEPIWTLLGNRYGKSVKVGVGLMSWMSLIGIEAVQIIAGAAILAVVGIPKITSMLILALLFCLLSLLPVEKLSWVLRGLLLLNILVLIYSLWALQGLSVMARAPVEFLTSLPQIAPGDVIGIIFCTIMLVAIDMKCQQYLVRAKDVGTAIWSCFLTAVTLIALALLAGTMAIAAHQAGILPPNLDDKETIPYILAWVSGGTERFLGIVAIATLAVPALGLGSSVLRVQTRTFFDLEILPFWLSQRILVAAINVLLALTIAIRGGEIVGLILLFYAAYLSAAWIPFIAYLLDYFDVYAFSNNSVRFSLIIGSISALVSLLLILVRPEAVFLGSDRLTITVLGMGMATMSLVVNELVEKLLLAPAVKKETDN